jgi:hypothetical protein
MILVALFGPVFAFCSGSSCRITASVFAAADTSDFVPIAQNAIKSFMVSNGVQPLHDYG